jgi:hypothetical protein
MPENETTTGPDTQSQKTEDIVFSYLKSNYFRVIHADGAWGGLSPRGDIHIAFYNERAAIPDVSKLAVSEGKVIALEEFAASSQLVREVEVDVVVDLVTAKGLQAWLTDKIRALEDRVREAEKEVIKKSDEKVV